jgi:FtsZ-binding cell division protein ZapB
MKIERLEELQQSINALRSINPEEGAALIAEIWRLRTAQTAKQLEVSCLKDGHDRLQAELDRMSEANRLLQAENDQLKSVHGLPKCDLENRWSNCVVRMRKRRELAATVFRNRPR